MHTIICVSDGDGGCIQQEWGHLDLEKPWHQWPLAYWDYRNLQEKTRARNTWHGKIKAICALSSLNLLAGEGDAVGQGNEKLEIGN